jgi:hypothetical protein
MPLAESTDAMGYGFASLASTLLGDASPVDGETGR